MISKQVVTDVYKEIDEILDECEEDYEYMVANPDNTFGVLMGAHAILGQILRGGENELE